MLHKHAAVARQQALLDSFPRSTSKRFSLGLLQTLCHFKSVHCLKVKLLHQSEMQLLSSFLQTPMQNFSLLLPSSRDRSFKVKWGPIIQIMELSSVVEFESLLEDFKAWIKLQPDLPQNIGKNAFKSVTQSIVWTKKLYLENMLLLRFLKVSRCRPEKAQRLLRYSIELRQANPHIFSDRDPMSEKIQEVFKAV